MRITVGKHKDMLVSVLVLKQPGYVSWIQSQEATGALASVKAEAERLIRIFNSKPFLIGCRGRGCKQPATYCSVYANNAFSRMWWCDQCDPYGEGAADGKLIRVRSYEDALSFCELFPTTKAAINDLIKGLAMAKGLSDRVGEKQAENFFAI